MMYFFKFRLILLVIAASVHFAAAQAKLPTSRCEMKVAELTPLAGVTFDMKMTDVSKLFKTVRVLTAPINEIMGQTKIHTLRPVKIDPIFKDELLTVELAHSSKFGITSIALNFRPRTKITPDDLFSKITVEIGLPPSVWAFNDFGGRANYLKWDVVCNDFNGSMVAQTGYMNRLSLWRNPTSNPTRKPEDPRNIGG